MEEVEQQALHMLLWRCWPTTDTYQQNGNAKTIFNTTGCMQTIGCHECLAYMELIQNPI